MDCCGTNKSEDIENKFEMKGGRNFNMNRRIALWGVIGVLFIAAVFMTFQAGATSGVETIQAAAPAAKSAASSYGGMVGGC